MHLSLSILLRTFSFHLHLLFIWQASEVQLEGQPALCPAEAAQPVPDLYPLTLCSRGVPKPFRQNFPAAWPNSLHSTAVCQLEMCTHLCRGRTGGTPRHLHWHLPSSWCCLTSYPSFAWFFFFFKRNKTPPFSEGKGEQPIETDLFSFLVLLLPRTTQQQKDMIQ